MTQAALTQSLKRAFRETLNENRDAVRDLLAEVIEDVSLANAIRVGGKSKRVLRASVLKSLSRSK